MRNLYAKQKSIVEKSAIKARAPAHCKDTRYALPLPSPPRCSRLDQRSKSFTPFIKIDCNTQRTLFLALRYFTVDTLRRCTLYIQRAREEVSDISIFRRVRLRDRISERPGRRSGISIGRMFQNYGSAPGCADKAKRGSIRSERLLTAARNVITYCARADLFLCVYVCVYARAARSRRGGP